MTTEELEIVDALRRYAKTQEAEAAEKAPLPPNSTKDLMARIRREEARQGAKRTRWLVILECLTVLAATVGLGSITIVLVVSMLNVPIVPMEPQMPPPPEVLMNVPPNPIQSFTVRFEMASPQDIKGESPRAPDFFLDPSPILTVDWSNKVLRIPLRTGGEIYGRITPKAGAPGAAAREFDIAASGTSNGETITATGQIVAMPNKPDDAPQSLKAKDVEWLKLNLTLRGNAREEQVYRVFGSP